MAADPLSLLLRVRRLAADQARRSLAESLRAEATAADAVAAVDAAVARETRHAAEDHALAAFATWLSRVRAEQDTAQAALRGAEMRTQDARAALAADRAAVRAVEELMARRAAERQADLARREQHALDEVARRAAT